MFKNILVPTDGSALSRTAAKDRKCDLIFMASHGRTGLPVQILGSVAQKAVAARHRGGLI